MISLNCFFFFLFSFHHLFTQPSTGQNGHKQQEHLDLLPFKIAAWFRASDYHFFFFPLFWNKMLHYDSWQLYKSFTLLNCTVILPFYCKYGYQSLNQDATMLVQWYFVKTLHGYYAIQHNDIIVLICYFFVTIIVIH